MRKQQLLNSMVNNLTMDEAISIICNFIDERKITYIVPINVDVVIKMENDDYLKEIVNQADLTLIDGQPLIWIGKIKKSPIKEKISGSDIVPLLCKMASQKNYSLYIIGGKEGVAKTAKYKLERKYPSIRVVGTYSPPFGFENDSNELKAINDDIRSKRPDILIACFGCPKQEKWVYENYKNYAAHVSICAGATVNFLAGNISRAPSWMSRFGLEWFYRFLHEPRRLFKRYFVDDLKVFKLIRKYK